MRGAQIYSGVNPDLSFERQGARSSCWMRSGRIKMEFGMQNPNKKQPICAGNQLYYNLRVQDLEVTDCSYDFDKKTFLTKTYHLPGVYALNNGYFLQ